MFATKSFDARVKAVGESGLEDGEFEAIVATYSKDSYGDIIIPGAFQQSLNDWAAKGAEIPLIWSHDWGDPFSHIGTIRKAEEIPGEGLKVRGFISPEERNANAKAAQIWRLMKSRRVTQFSFAYDIVDGGFAKADDAEYYELRELKIHEVGPCLLGVNQETELLAAKAAGLKGADLGAGAREALSKAYETIGRLLDITPQDPPTDNGEDHETDDEDAANPSAGPASDPGSTPASTIRQRLDIELELAADTDTPTHNEE